ncbi:hypothetical protein [Tepidibacter sp. Z1-5]|uniref:hypothetical protein n=1 Tax=Tepidibacter sp. Z1-5 TaxID=3134138 RepID=UPI0030C614F1
MGEITKVFKTKDFFYNNGLVNIRQILKGKIEGLEIKIYKDRLELILDKNQEDEIFKKIFSYIIKELNIVHRTDNKRIYYYEENKKFVYDYKFNVKDAASANDIKYTYSYITPKELGKSVEQIYIDCNEFCEKNNVDIKECNNLLKKGNNFKEENKCKIPKYITLEEAVNNYSNYYFQKEKLKFDSKVHTFKGGDKYFNDMLDDKEYIDKWDMLVYFYGVKSKKFYNRKDKDNTFVIYPNSNNLKTLLSLKKNLNISEQNSKTEKDGEIIEFQTNMNMFEMFKQDGVKNHYIHLSTTEEEFRLKSLLYIFSYINSLEIKDYEEDVDKTRKKLFEDIKNINFITYVDAKLKSSLTEYTKAYMLFDFFDKLKKYDEEGCLYKYVFRLISSFSQNDSKEKDKGKTSTKQFCDNLMSFKDLRKAYYNLSFNLLKYKIGSLGKEIYSFECEYLKFLRRGDKTMNLHEKGKLMGDEIGKICANLDSKDFLYRLRNIKNHNQFVGYLSSMSFEILKKSSIVYCSGDFKNTLDEVLNYLSDNNDDWEVIRDYMAIYAINKYQSVNYAKNKGDK